jgi:hypothetical protein
LTVITTFLQRHGEEWAPKALALTLVRIGGLLMRASTLSIAVTLMLVPLPAVAFDQDEFCTTVSEIARRMNTRVGRWLDRSTRHDGIEVDCGLKKLETKRFLKADPDDMREGWEARKQRAWNAAYCNNEAWREAIDNGWSIISTLTFRTGETVSFVAEC